MAQDTLQGSFEQVFGLARQGYNECKGVIPMNNTLLTVVLVLAAIAILVWIVRR